MGVTSQRLDKWLWFARFVKTRTQASRLIASGKVRVNRNRVTKPASPLRIDDIVTLVANRQLRVARVVDPGRRRGPAPEAQLLYEDLTPKSEPEANEKPVKVEPSPIHREKGAGRPTKKDRRKLDKFRHRFRRDRKSFR